MNPGSLIQLIAISALPILFAITVHEVAHGWVASKLGDQTARMLGRLTLNPVKHIDPIGTIAVPLLTLLMGGMIFGWAKPVPVTWENLKHPKRDMALVAAAGPIANLLMAIFWIIVMKIAWLMVSLSPGLMQALISMGQAGILINLLLMVLNLLPIPPLDGSRVVSSLLSGRIAWRYNQLENYGLIIILLLLMSGILGKLIMTPVESLMSGLYLAAGI